METLLERRRPNGSELRTRPDQDSASSPRRLAHHCGRCHHPDLDPALTVTEHDPMDDQAWLDLRIALKRVLRCWRKCDDKDCQQLRGGKCECR